MNKGVICGWVDFMLPVIDVSIVKQADSWTFALVISENNTVIVDIGLMGEIRTIL